MNDFNAHLFYAFYAIFFRFSLFPRLIARRYKANYRINAQHNEGTEGVYVPLITLTGSVILHLNAAQSLMQLFYCTSLKSIERNFRSTVLWFGQTCNFTFRSNFQEKYAFVATQTNFEMCLD